MMIYILDDEKNVIPASMKEWSDFFMYTDRHVKFDVIGKVLVSTVFVGLENIIFETALLTDDDVTIAQRYDTWDEAILGHNSILGNINKY